MIEDRPDSLRHRRRRSALDAVVASLVKAGEFFDDERRSFARLRHSVIAANAELHERELIKMATLAAALAQGLRERGIGEPDASLAAEAGIAVFRVRSRSGSTRRSGAATARS